MPNVAAVLKNEISRLSKRAVRQYVAPVQSATTAQRKQLAVLRTQVQQLQRQVALLERTSRKVVRVEELANGAQIRFSPKGLRSLRKRLDLSAEDFGRLVSVGAQTIYAWEGEKSAPRPQHLPAIAELRKIGKREALARLEKLNGS